MSTAGDCPSRDELEQFLEERLPADSRRRVAAHIGGCALCQTMLEVLTAETQHRIGAVCEPPDGATEFLNDLKQSSRDDPDDDAVTTQAGTPPGGDHAPWPTVPGYVILGVLGRGGEGVVYKARQRSLNRVVALKMVRADDAPTGDDLVRFRREAELLGRLKHPHIVPVYEVGEYHGRPYFVMEYVEGGTLASRLSGQPLPAADAAALLETVARAVHAAHEAGIVHRDLKPANILLTACSLASGAKAQAAETVPKISDFGLAKALQVDASLTRTGFVMGTPSYMAPEQVQGRNDVIGPCSDVYALGGVLYHLLSGRPPFLGPAPMDILTQVVEADPVPPRRLAPNVPRDLETVCLKCLQKEPAKRYATALELAEDLGRFRAGEPVKARATPAWERAWKWVRRRPAAAALLAVVVMAAAALLSGGLHYNAQLRAEAARADTEARTAARQRALALEAFRKLVYEVQDKLRADAKTRPLRESLLTTALDGLQKVAGSAGELPEPADRAAAYQQLGDILTQLGRTPEAREQFERCLQVAEGWAAAAPHDAGALRHLSGAHYRLGELDLKGDKPDLARGHFDSMIEAAGIWLRLEPSAADARAALAEGLEKRARCAFWVSDLKGAATALEQMRAVVEPWARDEPDDVTAKRWLASYYDDAGEWLSESGDHSGARNEYLKALALRHDLERTDPNPRRAKHEAAVTLSRLGSECPPLGDLASARKYLRQAYEAVQELSALDPDNVNLQCQVADGMLTSGVIEQTDLCFTDAIALYEKALRILTDLKQAGKLAGRPTHAEERPDVLRQRIAFCRTASRGIEDLAFALAQPPAVTHELLLYRTRYYARLGKTADAVASGTALCALKRQNGQEWYHLGRTCSVLSASLQSDGVSKKHAEAMQALQERCLRRAVEALAAAVEGGYNNLKQLEHDIGLTPVRQDAAFRALVERVRRTQPQPGSGSTP